MFDFDVIMESLGFEKEPIINAYSVCSSIIEDVREFAREMGFEDDFDSLMFDFDAEAVQTNFLGKVYRGMVDNPTFAIVESCFEATIEALENIEMFDTLDAHFIVSAPLVFQCGDKMHSLGELYILDTDCGEEICSALKEAVIDKLYDCINDSNIVENSGREYKKEWVKEDLEDGAYSRMSIANCLQYGLAGGTVIDTINARLKNEKEKSMDSRNGQYVRD